MMPGPSVTGTSLSWAASARVESDTCWSGNVADSTNAMGRSGSAAHAHQTLGQASDLARAHEHHCGALMGQQGAEVEILVAKGMAIEHHHAVGEPTHGDGEASHGLRPPTHELTPGTISKSMAGLLQGQDLLAAAAEEPRVASLEPHDAPTSASGVQEEGDDLLLADAVSASPLAHVMDFGVFGEQCQEFIRDEGVVDDGLGQQPARVPL